MEEQNDTRGNGVDGTLLPSDDAMAVVAAAAPPARKRGRQPGGGSGAASAPLAPGIGTKFFPKDAQGARQTARRLEPQLRQLVPQGAVVDWSGALARLEMACYKTVEDLCGDLQAPLEASISAELATLGRSGSGTGLAQTGSSGGGSEGSAPGGFEGSTLALAAAPAAAGPTDANGLTASRRGRQLNAMMHTFLADLHEAIDDLTRVHVDAAKQAAAKEYNSTMAGMLGTLPPELCGIPENVPGALLPPAVLHNREPYFSVPEWRKEPFPPRAYESLTEYAIRSNIPSERAVLAAKLRTRRPDGAAEHFSVEHGKELGAESCKLKEAELAAAVRERRVLKMNEHVVEVDCWGMDCYTRRNIFDAVRESGAFKYCRNGDSEAGSKSLGPGTSATAGQASADAEDPETADTAAGRAASAPPAGASAAEHHGAPGPAKQEPGNRRVRAPSPSPTPPLEQQPAPATAPAFGDDPTRDDEAIAVALAAEEDDFVAAPSRAAGGRQGRGRRKAAVAAGDRMQASAEGGAAAPGQLLVSPAPAACDPGEAQAINDWIDRRVLCTSIAKGREGWNLLRVLEAASADARARGDRACSKAAAAVIARLRQIGWSYFRLHPKGRGVVCNVPGGLPAFTFVEEYLGELHSPWRWFEIQDAIKKLTQQELPDFYNITLERPRDDPDGYDVLFVEAAFMASFASRMSHSCTPNCAAVVVSVNGRLTIAMYTKRRIEPGEELTFDYSSVTESEKEYREAICLCGSRLCRGSYLYYSGSTAFTQVMEQRHNFLHRQVMLLRASVEPLLEADRQRLKAHCIGPTSLGNDTPGNNRHADWAIGEGGFRQQTVDENGQQGQAESRARPPRGAKQRLNASSIGAPDWVQKWAALVLEYVELEKRELPGVLLALPPHLGRYTQQSAEIEAEAIAQNRVQQIVITLDKVKHVLRQPDQLQTAPMRLLSEDEVVEHLWSGANSVAKRTLKCAANHLCKESAVVQKLFGLWNANGGGRKGGGGDDDEALAKALPGRLADFASGPEGKQAPRLAKVVKVVAQKAKTPADARRLLQSLEAELRAVDNEGGVGVHTAAADMLHLYSTTLTWFTAERGYKASPEAEPAAVADDEAGPSAGTEVAAPADDAGPAEDAAASAAAAPKRKAAVKLSDPSVLCKRYGPWFMWGQLSGWYKQTVYDPTASLSAERRGTLSLPDVESFYRSGNKAGYSYKDRASVLKHIETCPDAQWRTSLPFNFRNDAKIYGSPMFDQIYLEAIGQPERNPMPAVLQHLKEVKTPLQAKPGKGGR
ncbi:hypothetical protein GPECTOR_53g102 [Gonium pectorale]|uniref:SET domain-containing protein n=1 Tax=Gonium pectorale TaxID=33097 RepID=A0A150G6L8_GONPE|nr:hypothetical protein GPECTOR_53g102 [Gonium pectorale]|eukprot:KXZ45516.1 hypothetical protein GPECTOR_53g102 [Gonium pectorale]